MNKFLTKKSRPCILFFFALSAHAAPWSGSLRRFRRGENGEGLAELWAAARHKALRAKNTVSTVFFTLTFCFCLFPPFLPL